MKNEVMGPEFRMLETMSKYCDGVVPPIFSWVFPGMCFMSVNSCEFLESIYIQQNQFHSKHESTRISYSTFIPSTIVFQATEDADYAPKRQALTGAFFKNKLVAMTKIIKAVTVNEVKRHLQNSKDGS